MNVLLALCAACGFAASSIAYRLYQIRLRPDESGCALFCVLVGLFSTVIYFILGSMHWSVSPAGLGISLLYGFCIAGAGLASALCYLWGPVSLTAVLMDASLAIPVLYSCVFLQERITVTQLVGIGLVIATFVVSSPNLHSQRDAYPMQWYVMGLVAFLFNGFSMVTMKQYKLAALGSDSAFFAIGNLLNTAVLAGAYYRFHRDAERTTQYAGTHGGFWILFFVGAQIVMGVVANRLMMELSIKMPAALLYPLINGGNCLFISLISCAFLKEKITPRKLIAFSLGLCSIVILNF